MYASDQIILSAEVVNRLPIYWQEFARYHAETGLIIIKDTSEKPEDTE
jgi:hypothetical protein